MPKKPHPSFGSNFTIRDANGKAILDSNGLPRIDKCRMSDATFANGTPQPLYFEDDHPKYSGYFKGMIEILRERGFDAPEKIRAVCKGFKCEPDAVACCQRRILFNQPDFVNVRSLAGGDPATARREDIRCSSYPSSILSSILLRCAGAIVNASTANFHPLQKYVKLRQMRCGHLMKSL